MASLAGVRLGRTRWSLGRRLRVRSSEDFALRGPVDDEWGRSESLDPDNVGDIADEGAGHRG